MARWLVRAEGTRLAIRHRDATKRVLSQYFSTFLNLRAALIHLRFIATLKLPFKFSASWSPRSAATFGPATGTRRPALGLFGRAQQGEACNG